MLTPLTINPSPLHQWYPLGDRPAINLLQDIQKEKECPDLLLLECGAIHDILFTCYMDRLQGKVFIHGLHYFLTLILMGNLSREEIVRLYLQ